MSSTPQTPGPSPSGLLLIDKHEGPTSMQVCAAIRARLRRAGAPKRIKVGHAGTLDPMATGLLVVMVGKATSLCDRLMASRKRYETTIDLAHTSDTLDRLGVVQSVACQAPSPAAIEHAIAAHVGTIMQAPPAFSAIKLQGERAYDLARAGKAVSIPPRPVVVHAIRVLGYEFPLLRLTIDCGKGTYVRSLARDIGHALGTGGMLIDLRRTASGQFDVASATPLSRLSNCLTQADLIEMQPLAAQADSTLDPKGLA